jgi:hypothetical protein
MVVDETGLLNPLQGGQLVGESSFCAAGKSICAAGRTIHEESAATQQNGSVRLTRGTGLATELPTLHGPRYPAR